MIGGVGPEFYTIANLERLARDATHEIRMAASELNRLVEDRDDPARSLERAQVVHKFMECASESVCLVLAVADGLPNE